MSYLKMKFNIFFAVLISSVVNLNAHLDFETQNEALDQSLFKEVLDEQLCGELIDVIRENTRLSLYLADAGIRIPKGVLQGNTLDMGNYHQCLDFNQQLQDYELQGKYCTIRVPVNQDLEFLEYLDKSKFDPSLLRLDNDTIRRLSQFYNVKEAMTAYTGVISDSRMTPDSPFHGLQFQLAVCIPKPCTTRQALDSLLFNTSAIGFEYSDLYCRLPNDKPRVPADYVAISLFLFIGAITLISTSYDLWHTFINKTDPKQVSVIGKSFSVYTNGRRLMTFTSGTDTIECLDGIRALAMAWVLLGHTFTSEISASNPLDTFTWITSWQALWVIAGHFTVDTFFFLSGFLVVYTTVGKLNGTSLFKNLHLFYLNRLLRMFPLLAAAVLLEATYLNHMTDGPNWTIVANQVNRCRTTWWSTLLHVQNYVNPANTCIGQSWYLAIDVQLHILSPIILVWVLSGKRKVAWTALAFGFFASLTAATVYIFIQEFPAVAPDASLDEWQNYLFNYYVNTLTRAPVFFVGMAFGYKVRVSKRKLTGIFAMMYWAAFFALMTFLIYFNYPINQPTWDNQFMSSVYNSFFRSFWGIGIGLLVYACVNGFGGPINWFLSLQVWKIHSRISYAMYLFHYMLMVAVNYAAIAPVFFSVGLFTFKFLAHYCFSFAVSFLLTLVLDVPFSTIFKLLLGGGAKKPTKKDDDGITQPAKENDKGV